MAGSFAETTRWKLRRLLGTSKVSDVDEGFQRLAEDCDVTFVGFLADTLAKRPAAGTPNRLFRATDTGVYYVDTGTVWQVLSRGAASVSWALVESSGTITASSGDLSITKVATGEYQCNFASEKAAAAYAVTATPFASTTTFARCSEVLKTGFKIVMADINTSKDRGFSVIVVAAT